MWLKQLQIESFRNINKQRFEFTKGINLIHGANAAGKTSILEAYYYLARGKSFRSRNPSHLISYNTDAFQLIGEISESNRIGLRREKNAIIIRHNGEPVKKLSDLVRLFPLFLITPQAHELIEKGPKIRRQFIDLGMFHVEHSYARKLNNYIKLLKQRNAALRTSREQANSWLGPLAEQAQIIDVARKKFIINLIPRVKKLHACFDQVEAVELNYDPGWNQSEGLYDQLLIKTVQDQKRGYTSLGPHCADVSLRINGKPAKDILSRGQQKLLVISLILAQLELLSDRQPTLLIDDLPSELDKDHQRILYQLLDTMPVQKVISAIEIPEALKAFDTKMFHVERGRLV